MVKNNRLFLHKINLTAIVIRPTEFQLFCVRGIYLYLRCTVAVPNIFKRVYSEKFGTFSQTIKI